MSLMNKLFPEHVKRRLSGQCATCGCDHPERKGFKDEISQKEFGISGMCQDCQDKIFAEPPEDDGDRGPE